MCYRSVTGVSHKCYIVLQGCRCVTGVLQVCYSCVRGVLQECFRCVKRVLQRFYKGVTGVLPWALRVFHRGEMVFNGHCINKKTFSST